MPSSAAPPSWVILGSVPRVSAPAAADISPGDDLSLALVAPPRVSLLTVARRLFPHGAVTARDFPSVLAADPSGLLLLHASQGRATGVVARAWNHYSWDDSVPGYFVLDPASASARVLPEPERITDKGHVGLLVAPGGGRYLVAEFQPSIDANYALLLSFSSDVGEWVKKKLPYPLPPRLWTAAGVLSHCGKLWWVDLSVGLITCDPFADDPVLVFVPLPPGKELGYREAVETEGGLDRYRAMGVSAGKLRFVDMYDNNDSRGVLMVSVWALPDPDATEWALEHEVSFLDIWADQSYKATGLPQKIPVLALIHPTNPAVVYFFLERYLFGVDLSACNVVECEVYDLIQPPRDRVASRFVHAWEPPRSLPSGTRNRWKKTFPRHGCHLM